VALIDFITLEFAFNTENVLSSLKKTVRSTILLLGDSRKPQTVRHFELASNERLVEVTVTTAAPPGEI
jgi:hypothetical protein